MADMTWYSRAGSDSRFLTKQAAAALATEQARSDGDRALGARIDQVKVVADAALPRAQAPDLTPYLTSEAAGRTYATKTELAQAQLGGGGKAPDLSPYATKVEVQQADSALGARIDSSATKAELGDYLKRSDAAGTYATKTELEQVKNQQGGGSPSPAPGPASAPLSALPLRAGQVVPTVGFFGDSWSTEATMGQGFNMPAVVSRLLGCVPMASAVDGSGFSYSASGHDGFEVDARVNAVCAAAPNLIVTIGSLNADKVIDNGDATGSAITEAVKTFVTKVRAKLPQVPIVVLGPQPSSVARLQSRSAHINVKATKAGVDASGGLGNGIAFVDWLGVVDRQAVQWRDGRVCATDDVVIYNGVAYRVTRAWVPASGETPISANAPVIQVSDVLSGTGHAGAPRGDGTRDTLLLSDETHPTKMGAVAFGAAAAKRIGDAVASLASWAKAQGPVVPATPAAPPPPPPAHGDGLPIMAWLSGGWGVPNRVTYSTADLSAVAALKPSQVALPLRGVADTADLAVGIPDSFIDKDGTEREFSNVSIQGARNLGLDVASLVESLDMFEAAGIEVLPNVRNGLADSGAEYYKSSDGKCFTVLASRTGKTYQEIHGRGQTALRGIMKAQYPAITRVVDATDSTADWHLTDPVKDAQKGILSAAKAGAGVWGAAKTVFPDGVWVLVTSKDEQETAKSAAQAAGVTIVGWAVATAEDLAAIKA